MQSFDVYRYVNALARTRGDDLSKGRQPTAGLSRTFPGDKIQVHVFTGHADCLQILRDTHFIQPRLADAVAAMFRSIGSEVKSIENFLGKNPVGLDGQPHFAARQKFIGKFRSAQRSVADSLSLIAAEAFEGFVQKTGASITADLVEPYIDTVVEAILHASYQLVEITRDSWTGYSACVFEYVQAPAKVKKKNAQTNHITSRLAAEAAGEGDDAAHSAAILLSYILQGRDPLIGGLSAYMHSLRAMDEEQRRHSIAGINARELFRRTCPVNYIGRVASKAATVGSVHVEAGDHILLMLPWANHDTAATAESSLAFGAGPHVCAGQALALAIAGAWLDGLKTHQMKILWHEIRPDRSAPAVFRQYHTE